MNKIIVLVFLFIAAQSCAQIDPYQIIKDSLGAHRILLTDSTGEYTRVLLRDAIADSIGVGKFVNGTDPLDAVYMDGNVGIGTNTPSTLLHLKSSGIPTIRIEDEDLSGGFSNFEVNGSALFIESYDEDGTEGQILFKNASNEAMRIKQDGKVGIGITNPNHKLQVYEETNLGSNVGDANDMFSIKSETANSDFLNFTTRRVVSGSNWETAKHRIQRKVDNSLMGYMQFGSPFGSYNDMITFGYNNTELVKIKSNGDTEINGDAEINGNLTVTDRVGTATKSAFFNANGMLVEGDLVTGVGIDSSLSKVDQNILATDTRVVDVDGKLIMRAGETSSAGIVVSASSTISGNKYSALNANTSSSTSDGFYALETGGVRIRIGDEDEGRILYSTNTSGNSVWGQADNVGRITTTLGLWSDERQVFLATTAYASFSAFTFPPSNWTTSQQHDGDVLTLINRSGSTRQLTGDIEGTTSTTVDILDDDTIRLVYYSGGDYWIVLSNN